MKHCGTGLVMGLLMVLTGCAIPAPLRVVSYGMPPEAADSPQVWTAQRDSVLQTVQQHKPDVLALQGVLAPQVQELRAALPDYEFVGVGSADGASAGEFAPIFYRKQRFLVVDQGHFWLSATPEQVGSRGWDAEYAHVATWVRLRFKDAVLRDVQIVNTQFDDHGPEARLESARLLRKLSESYGGRPLMVVGEFNCAVGSKPYKTLTEDRSNLAEFKDAHASASSDKSSGKWASKFGQWSDRSRWILFNRRFEIMPAEDAPGHMDVDADGTPLMAILKISRAAAGSAYT